MTGSSPAVLDAAAQLAAELADAAGEVIRPYFRQPVEIIDKDDASPVTIADREAEAAMRRLIGARFPEHGIFGEEYGVERPDAEWVWVLDPIDGTKSFISGVPLFGTLIALLHRGRPVLGVLDQPISRERWVGVEGEPTRLNGQPVKTRACAEIGRAAIFSTAVSMFDAEDRPRFDAIAGAAKLVRFGADCYAYGLVACGFVDAVIEGSLKPYDYCAHVPIIAGAGGIVTDFQGRPPGLESDGRIVAAGDPALHAQLIERLA